ncbi:helix-turn-helix domain-containing protein [Niabella insulamsoli]|uniref:helix-turn-helix domain-containing protein n=1 Tax=Niabella insulamsoli TaxID=3144874 RepID=UPI0031FD7313
MSSPYYHLPDDNNQHLSSRLITLGDLFDFRKQLFSEIRQLIKELHGQPVKKWLKSHEVRKLLGISPSTLQILRRKKALGFTKIGGVLYYDADEINRMLQAASQLPTQS